MTRNKVGEYHLMNEDRLERALHGTLGRGNVLVGGVGDDATDEQLLAEYDRLGGFITKNGLAVKMGSFYDFKGKKPHTTPQVAFILNVDGQNIEGTEDEAAALQSAREKISNLKNRKNKSADEAGSNLSRSPSGIKDIANEDGEEETVPVKTKRRSKPE